MEEKGERSSLLLLLVNGERNLIVNRDTEFVEDNLGLAFQSSSRMHGSYYRVVAASTSRKTRGN